MPLAWTVQVRLEEPAVSSATVWRDHDHEADLEIHADPTWRDIVAQVMPALTDEGRRLVQQEVGAALLESLATANEHYVNRAVEAWLRTLLLKLNGTDEVLDEPWPENVSVLSLDEIRARRAE